MITPLDHRYDDRTKQFRMWYNSFVSMSPDKAHPAWKRQFPGLAPMHRPGSNAGMLYATSPDGVNWTKAKLDMVRYGWNGTAATPPKGGTNLVMLQSGNPDNGVMFDVHEPNASKRYGALGSFYLRQPTNHTTPHHATPHHTTPLHTTPHHTTPTHSTPHLSPWP